MDSGTTSGRPFSLSVRDGKIRLSIYQHGRWHESLMCSGPGKLTLLLRSLETDSSLIITIIFGVYVETHH